MNSDKELAISYKDETIRLTYTKDPNKFLSPTTLALRYGKGGKQFVCSWYLKKKKKKTNAVRLKELLEIDKAIASTKSRPELEESIEMQTVETVEKGIKTFIDANVQTELALGPEGSLPFRELAGLDRSLRNMRTTVLKITSDREAKKETLRQLKDEFKDELNNVLNVEDDSLLREKQEEI